MDDVLAWSTGGVAAVSDTSDVVEVPVDSALDGPTSVFVKRYLYNRFSQRIKQSFRGTLFGKSRARREFEFLTEMRRRQVPTVRPIAFGDSYGHAFLRASFLITEGNKGLQSLDMFALNALRREPLKRSQRKALTKGLAATIREMHDAGVYHGGLFWRNILVGIQPDGEYRFVLLDPDTHGRLHASPVPESGVVADLSDVVASATALGRRAGLVAFLTAYFQVSRLTAEQRELASQIIQRARTLAPSEHRRMAVTEAIGWLRQRAAGVERGDFSIREFGSVEDFFDQISSGATASTPVSRASKTIRFVFSDTTGESSRLDRTVILDGNQAAVVETQPAGQDLVIRTDPGTWLAVISGHADAYARLRSGRLRMEGDPSALGMLIEHLDQRESTGMPNDLNTKTNIEAGHEPRGDEAAMQSSPQPSQRNFGHKYKADDYAQYYAEKHESSWGRRISNNLERRMVRRSLLRIQQNHPFKSVLDCPSGTGRFLPSLASLSVSVIAMDTSAAVLREGRKHHALFKEPPVELVGSALSIALPDNAVDVVLCSRLLHHIGDPQERSIILGELARVARLGVVISFFDSGSFRAWRRASKARRTGRIGGRHAMSRETCVQEAVGVGLKPIGMNALLRYHTEVTAAAFLC